MSVIQTFSIMQQLGQTVLSHLLILKEDNRQKGRTFWQEVKEAWDWRRILKALFPCAFLFTLSMLCGNLAWGMNIDPALATVLGSMYFPASCLLSRWILQKLYLWLEWLAVAIITLNMVSYAMLKQFGNKHEEHGTSVLALVLVLASATFSAAAGLTFQNYLSSEKGKPFMMQKLRVDIAQVFINLIMLPLIGLLSMYLPTILPPENAFWNCRPLTKWCNRNGACGSWANGSFSESLSSCGYAYNFTHDNYTTHGFVDYATVQPAAAYIHDLSECSCASGVFVDWGTPRLWIVVLVCVIFFYLTALVVVNVGSVLSAVFQNFGFALMYFVSDPFIKPYLPGLHSPPGGTLHDGALNLCALMYPVSAQAFIQATEELNTLKNALEKGQAENAPCIAAELAVEEQEEGLGDSAGSSESASE
jgi:hypothetical protein